MAANETRLTATPTPAVAAPPPNTLQAIVAQRRLESRARRQRILDLLLLTLTLILGFALASTPIRNSDFYMHLATGRLIAQGDYSFGVDPFSHTTEGQVWVNHSWLFDLGLYLFYQVMGIPGIIVVKGIATVGLGLLLVRISRIGPSFWWPVVTTALALLCVGTRLLIIQPTLVSFLLLPATLGILLWRGGMLTQGTGPTPATAPVVPWHYWPLWPLFVLWVNCDEWFILGPVTVALFALGQWLQSVLGKQTTPLRAGEMKALVVAVVAGFAVCLVNPHHVRAFQVPSTLGWFGTAAHGDLERDALFKSLYFTPLEKEYYQDTFGLSVTGMAMVPLAAIGLMSFLLNFRTIRYWRLLLWVAFLLLGMSHARAIPFFGVIAAPIAALNFQDHALARWSNPAHLPVPLRRWLYLGRGVTALALLVLLVLCWPGWIHAKPYYPKRIAWSNELDPTLEESAKTLKRLRADGTIPADARGFNYAPEVANYLAWHCPEEKGFFDFRYQLQVNAAKDYVDIRRALQQMPELEPGDDGLARLTSKVDWSRMLKKRKVTHVILWSSDPLVLIAQMTKFASEPREWTLLHVDAHTAIYGYNEASPQMAKAAFRPEEEALNPDRKRWLNPEPAAQYPEPPDAWDQFTTPQGRRDLNIDEANMYMMLFEAEKATLPRRRAEIWDASMAAGVVVGSAQGSVPLLPLTMLDALQEARKKGREELDKPRDQQKGFRYSPMEQFVVLYRAGFVEVAYDRGPEWYPLLAVRAARRGLAINYQDANAHQSLAEAYMKLSARTREVYYRRDPNGIDYYSLDANLLGTLREVQILSALTQALALNPDLEAIHTALVSMYERRGYFDLALRHRKEELRLTRQRGERVGETRANFDARVKDLDDRLSRLQTSVQKSEDQYELQSSTFKDDQQRAQRAYSLNLADKALSIFRNSDPESIKKFGRAEAELYLRLLLDTGQLKELAEGFDKNFEKVLGKFTYQRYRALIAIARGNYAEADRGLEEYGNLLRDTVRKLPSDSADLTTAQKSILNVYDPLAVALRASKQSLDARPYAAATIGQLMVECNPQFGSPLWLFLNSVRVDQRLASVDLLCGVLRDCAEVYIVRGLLAMEVGDTERAASLFRRALKEWNSGWDGESEGINPFRDYANDDSSLDVSGHRLHLYAADFLKHMKKKGK